MATIEQLVREPETLDEYFARPDTPSAGSPIGKAMTLSMAKCPGITFAEARTMARDALTLSANRKNYKSPSIYSVEEEAARAASAAAHWKKLAETRQATAQNAQDGLESAVSERG